MKDIEELRSTWKKARVKTEKLDGDNRRAAALLARSRAVTAQQKLARHYKVSLIASLLMPVLSPMLLKLGFSVFVALLYAFYGVVMVFANFSFYRYIVSTDLASLPVVPALFRAVNIVRRQKLTSILSMAFAFMLCLTMVAQAFYDTEDSVFLGMATGFVLAVVIGAVKNRKLSRLADSIKKELSTLI